MGADLYIEKMPRDAQYLGFEVSEKAVDLGYFRDCYNSSGLLAVMSATLDEAFSWWGTADRKDLFNNEGEMTVEGAKKWLAELEPHITKFVNSSELPNIEKEDIQYYHDWSNLLVKFLKLAIEQDSNIIWSV